MSQKTPPYPYHEAFTIAFSNGRFSPACIVPPEGDPVRVCQRFGLKIPRPALFISGGAGMMSDDDVIRTRAVVEEGIVAFAQRYDIAIVDGGTHSGIMRMIGEARQRGHYTFPLIGVAPLNLVAYPGHEGQDMTPLNEDHSHFILVEGDEWGEESHMIIATTRAIAGNGVEPLLGILINGGRIAERDIYLATAQGENRVPVMVLDGSGRKANEIATASRTGKTDSAIIRAIVSGGDITVASIDEGPQMMWQRLEQHFIHRTRSS